MSDLTDFLLARIAEDDEAARAATPGPWEWDRTPRGYWGHQPPDLVTVAKEPPYSDGSVEPLGVVVSSYGYDADGLNVSDEDAEHISRWDPARVLAECDAKRRIVEYASAQVPADDRNPCGSHGITVMLLLALPYADHPDYREEWRP